MTDLWTTLLPLMIGSAVLPIQLAITVLLLQAEGGRRTAAAWVGGMTVVRLLQGVVFGLVIGIGVAGEETSGPSLIVSTLLLVVAIGFYITAAKKLVAGPDEDAPPPRWMSMVESIDPTRAFLLGAAWVGISPKLWAFTLAGIAAVAYAELGAASAIVTFLVFVVGAQAIHLGLLALTIVVPDRSVALLARASGGLERHGPTIMIALSLVFGTFFLVKALAGLGVL